jgi:hypothetical protein
VPLFAQAGRRDNEDSPLPFRPLLRDDQARLNGLAQANLIGEQRAFGQRRLEGKERDFNLVGVEIHLRIHKRTGQLLHAIRGAALR